MKKKKNIWIDLVMLLLFIVGAGALLYPFVSDSVHSFLNQQIIDYYQDQAIRENDEEMNRIHAEMEEKNKEIAKQNAPGIDPYLALEEDEQVQDVSQAFYEDHTIGVVTIPKINVQLPIFDSTLPVFLEKGASLLEGTSFPTGGENTHSVITSHAGLTQAKLFTDLEKLEEGDQFFVDINNRTLAYEVNQIKVVLPTETEDVKVVEGEDFTTLLTCTPYMINTHRLLVRGERIPYLPTTRPIDQVAEVQQRNVMIYGAVLLSLLVFSLWIFSRILFNYRISKRTYDVVVPLADEGPITFALMNAKGTKPVHNKNGERIKIETKESIPGGKYRLMNKEEGLDILLFIKKVSDDQFSLKFN